MANNVGATVGRRLTTAGASLSRVQRPAIEKAALILTTHARTGIRSMTSTGRLRNVGRRGAKVGARYDVKGHGSPVAIVRATGPLHLLERGTSPHAILPRARRRRSGRAALRLPDGGVRRQVQHPGTSGKGGFGRGIEAGLKPARDALRRAAVDAVVRAVKGGIGL